jgi:predicted enzyme related to lactoylglutathione lyase
MSHVVGIGGVFIKARDPDALRAWYARHLGLQIEGWGGMVFHWNRPDSPGDKGMTVWSVFAESSKYFDPSTSRFMINYIVQDLAEVLAALRSEGCDVAPKSEENEYGKFGWVMDPEGNRIELWQPPERMPDES